MRKQNVYVMIFIFIMTMLLTISIYFKTQDLYGNVGYNRFIIKLKGSSPIQNAFDKSDAEKFERVLAPELMTYYTFNKGQAVTEQSRSRALICGIKGEYNEFYNMRLKRGSFLNEKDYSDGNYVAVIDEKLAINLFGSTDVTGLDVHIYNKKFKIIGITGDNPSIADKLIEKELPYVYIPLSVMQEAKQDYSIANIELKPDKDSLDKFTIEDKIALIGKNPVDFYIEDCNEIGILSKQRFDILMFIIGMYWLCTLFVLISNILKNSIALLKSYLRYKYFSNIIKDMGLKLLITFAKITGVMAAIILIWKEISFDLYILPGSFPKDLTSINDIFETLRKVIMEFIRTDNSYMLHNNLVISFLHRQGSLIFILSLLCELYILFFMLKNVNTYFDSNIEAVKGLSFCYMVSALLSYFILYIMGFNVELPIVSVILVWASLFTITMVNSNKYIKPESMGVKNE